MQTRVLKMLRRRVTSVQKLVLIGSDSYNECSKFLPSARTQASISLDSSRTLTNVPAAVEIAANALWIHCRTHSTLVRSMRQSAS